MIRRDWRKPRGGYKSGSCPPKYETDALYLLLSGSLAVLLCLLFIDQVRKRDAMRVFLSFLLSEVYKVYGGFSKL